MVGGSVGFICFCDTLLLELFASKLREDDEEHVDIEDAKFKLPSDKFEAFSDVIIVKFSNGASSIKFAMFWTLKGKKFNLD